MGHVARWCGKYVCCSVCYDVISLDAGTWYVIVCSNQTQLPMCLCPYDTSLYAGDQTLFTFNVKLMNVFPRVIVAKFSLHEQSE